MERELTERLVMVILKINVGKRKTVENCSSGQRKTTTEPEQEIRRTKAEIL